MANRGLPARPTKRTFSILARKLAREGNHEYCRWFLREISKPVASYDVYRRWWASESTRHLWDRVATAEFFVPYGTEGEFAAQRGREGGRKGGVKKAQLEKNKSGLTHIERRRRDTFLQLRKGKVAPAQAVKDIAGKENVGEAAVRKSLRKAGIRLADFRRTGRQRNV